MIRLLFLFLFLPVLLQAQTPMWEIDTLPLKATRISLPPMKIDYVFGARQFIITEQAGYKALFADSVQGKLPEIDFTRYELQSRIFCIQCVKGCRDHRVCHRNACMFTRMWYLQEKKNRIALIADTLCRTECELFMGFDGEMICRNDSSFSVLKKGCRALKKTKVDFNSRVVVARELYLDSNARIENEFYLDTAAHQMVWRLFSGNVGSRSSEARTFVFSIPKPPQGYVIRFEEFSFENKE